MLLALACLWGCQSTPTGSDSNPGEVTYGGPRAIDHAYLMDLHKLDEERQQALQDGLLKELSPAEMRELQDSFESRRKQLRAQWQEARAGHTRN